MESPSDQVYAGAHIGGSIVRASLLIVGVAALAHLSISILIFGPTIGVLASAFVTQMVVAPFLVGIGAVVAVMAGLFMRLISSPR